MIYETIQIILAEWLNKNKNLIDELRENIKMKKNRILFKSINRPKFYYFDILI